MSVLSNIQSQLNAPKNQYNNFAGFKYRSAEDILTALKPLLAKHQYSVVINDTLEMIGERYYVKATVSLYDEKMALVTYSTAYAREELSLKGQQASQITGGTSSYARKYALNALFLIDDTNDADTQYNTSHTQPKPIKMINNAQLKLVNTLISKKAVDRDKVKEAYSVLSLSELTAGQTQALIKQLESKPDVVVE